MTGQDSLSKRIGRWAALLIAVFGLGLAVVVGQRLSQDSLALLLGLGCGVAVMTPTLGLGFLLLRREWARSSAPTSSLPAVQPPVIVVAPPALPGYSMPSSYTPSPAVWPQPANTGRTFTIVGGDE
ncbi:MAG TPA: hypothetical protein PKH77_25905 [Anaerolineae bacterium]|nr:hypothetical protein [Anaerolineae bacterium]